jgi:general secretion pathway protein D
VIGGLIDDSFSRTVNKIPCMGDIPMLGWLFRTNSESKEKTNLYVFLTPRVIKNPDEAEQIYDEKKKSIDAIEEKSINMYDSDAHEDRSERKAPETGGP